MTVKIELTTHKGGFFEFRICKTRRGRPVTQKCLDDTQLPIKEGYLKGTPLRFYPKKAGDFNLTVALPPKLKCRRCVFQWRYRTGTGWGTDPNSGKEGMGKGPQEEFYNCADIRIGGKVPQDLSKNAYFAPLDHPEPTVSVDKPTIRRKIIAKEKSGRKGSSLELSSKKLERSLTSEQQKLDMAMEISSSAEKSGSPSVSVGLSTGSKSASQGLDVQKTITTGTQYVQVDAKVNTGFVDAQTGDSLVQTNVGHVGKEVHQHGNHASVDAPKPGLHDGSVIQSDTVPVYPDSSQPASSDLAIDSALQSLPVNAMTVQRDSGHVGMEMQGHVNHAKVDPLKPGLYDRSIIQGDPHPIQIDTLPVYPDSSQSLTSAGVIDSEFPALPMNDITAISSIEKIPGKLQDIHYAKSDTIVDQRVISDTVPGQSLTHQDSSGADIYLAADGFQSIDPVGQVPGQVLEGSFPTGSDFIAEPNIKADGQLGNDISILSSSNLASVDHQGAAVVANDLLADAKYRPANSGPLHPDETMEKSHQNKTKKTEKTMQQVTTKNITLPGGHKVVKTKTKTVEVKVTETTNVSAEKNGGIKADVSGTATEHKVNPLNPDAAASVAHNIKHPSSGDANLPTDIGTGAATLDPTFIAEVDPLGIGIDKSFPEIHVDTSKVTGTDHTVSGFDYVVKSALNGIIQEPTPRESAKASHEVRSLKNSKIDPLMLTADVQSAMAADTGHGSLDVSAVDSVAGGGMPPLNKVSTSKSKKRRKGRDRKKTNHVDVKSTSRKAKINLSHGTSNKVVNEIDLTAVLPDQTQTNVAFIIVDSHGHSPVSAIDGLGQRPDHMHPIETAPSNVMTVHSDHLSDQTLVDNIPINPIEMSMPAVDVTPTRESFLHTSLKSQASDKRRQDRRRKAKLGRVSRRKSRQGKSRKELQQLSSGDIIIESGPLTSGIANNIPEQGPDASFEWQQFVDHMQPSQTDPSIVQSSEPMLTNTIPLNLAPSLTITSEKLATRRKTSDKRRHGKSRRRNLGHSESKKPRGIKTRLGKSGRGNSRRTLAQLSTHDRMQESGTGVSDIAHDIQQDAASFVGDIGPPDSRQSIQETRQGRDSLQMQEPRVPPPLTDPLTDPQTRTHSDVFDFPRPLSYIEESGTQTAGREVRRPVEGSERATSLLTLPMEIQGDLRAGPDRRAIIQEMRAELQSFERGLEGLSAGPPRVEGGARSEGHIKPRDSIDRQSGRLIIESGGSRFNPASGFSTTERRDRLGGDAREVFEPRARGRYEFSSGGVVGVPDNTFPDLRSIASDPRSRGRYHFSSGGAIGVPDIPYRDIGDIAPGVMGLSSSRGRAASRDRIIGRSRDGRPINVDEPRGRPSDSTALRDSGDTAVYRDRIIGRSLDGRPIYVSDLADGSRIRTRSPIGRDSGRMRGVDFERQIVHLPGRSDRRATSSRRTAATAVDLKRVGRTSGDTRDRHRNLRTELEPRQFETRARGRTESGRRSMRRTDADQRRRTRTRESDHIQQMRESRASARADIDARASAVEDRRTQRRTRTNERRRSSTRRSRTRPISRIEGNLISVPRGLDLDVRPTLRSRPRSRTRSRSDRRHILAGRDGDVQRLRQRRLRGDTSTPDASRRVRLGQLGFGEVVGSPVTIRGDRYLPIEVPYTVARRLFPGRARSLMRSPSYRGVARTSPLLPGGTRSVYPFPRSSGLMRPYSPLPFFQPDYAFR